MAWPPGDYFEDLIRRAEQILSDLQEEIPHQHDLRHNLTLTENAMTSSDFLEWLNQNDQPDNA